MSAPSASAAHPANPSPFTSRYEIRQLTLADLDAATAVVRHSSIFHSPIFSILGSRDPTLVMKVYQSNYLLRHQIDSGLSYGVFDTQYQNKRPESAATNGKVYWDVDKPATDPAVLLEQIDSPLVSVACSYDQFYPLDMAQMAPNIRAVPLLGTLYQALAAGDKRNPADWRATAAGQVLMRNGTATRVDYHGQGIMKKMAHWLMREAKLKGYRNIQIECGHDAVTDAWLHPPAPFTGELISSFNAATYEEDSPNGEKLHPFSPSKQLVTKVYVTL